MEKAPQPESSKDFQAPKQSGDSERLSKQQPPLPNKGERQAAERLGKPPPEEVSEEAVVFSGVDAEPPIKKRRRSGAAGGELHGYGEDEGRKPSESKSPRYP